MNAQSISGLRKSLASRWVFLWHGWRQKQVILDLCGAFEKATPEAQSLAAKLAEQASANSKLEQSLVDALAQIKQERSKIEELRSEIAEIKGKSNWNRESEYEYKLRDMKRSLEADKDLFQANIAAINQELVRVKRGNEKLLKFIHETKRLDEPFNPESIRGILQAETNKRLKPMK